MQRAREDAGYEQEEAAERLGVHAVTLSRYENGKRPIPDEVRAKMRSLYRVSAKPRSAKQPAEAPTVAIPLHVLTYWRGRVEEQVASVSGVARSLAALQGMLERATAGMTELVDSGVLPAPHPDVALVEQAFAPLGKPATPSGGGAKEASG